MANGSYLIPFNQSHFTKSRDWDAHPRLKRIEQTYNGLCEIISNFMLIHELLGTANEEDYLKRKITLSNLESCRETHILNNQTTFSRILATTLKIYPYNILSLKDQWICIDSNKKVNQDLLKKKFKEIKLGETLKTLSFNVLYFRSFFSFWNWRFDFSGHSVLIKKVCENQFIFFDPNIGEKRGLTFESLVLEFDRLLKKYDRICFLSGTQFLNSLRENCIEQTV